MDEREAQTPYRLLLILESAQPGVSPNCKVKLDGGHTWELDEDVPIIAVNILPGEHHLDFAAGRGVQRSTRLSISPRQHITRIFLRVGLSFIEYSIDSGVGTTSVQSERAAAAPARPAVPAQPQRSGRRAGRVLGIIAVILLAIIAGMLIYRLASNAGSPPAESAPPADASEPPESAAPAPRPEFHTGEAWTVEDQWSLTVTGARVSEEWEALPDQAPGVVYIVDYSYTNLGYHNPNADGLYLNLESAVVVDGTGKVGFTYPLASASSPRETPVGATCDAQAVFGVENPGSFRVTFSTYDGEGARRSAVFIVDVETGAEAETAE